MRARRSKLSLIRSEADLPGDVPMKHPVRSDFDTAVTEAGVTVTFKSTKSIYSFYRLADSEDFARLGPVSPGACPTRGTEWRYCGLPCRRNSGDGAAYCCGGRHVSLVSSRRERVR